MISYKHTMEFKHFSHPHSLSFHQTPQTREAICSGCKSLLSSGSVYSCWQCNFFLHEQCFNAARSIDHNSHPSHPLSLFPSPTYPSRSFFCKSCNLTGTGFSYSCSSCEFDLHIHCASMPENTTHDPYPNLSNKTHSLSQETESYSHKYAYNTPEANAYGNVFAGLTPHPQYSFPSEVEPSLNATIGHWGQALSSNQPPHLPPYTSEFSPSNPPYPYISEATSHGSFLTSPKPPHFLPNEPLTNANVQFGMSGYPISAYQQTNGLLTPNSMNLHIPPPKTYESYGNGPYQQGTEAQHIPLYTSEPYPSNHPHPSIPEAISHKSEVGNPNPHHILPSEPPPNLNVQMAAHTEPESYQQTHGQQPATITNQSVSEAAIQKKSINGPQKQPVPNKDMQNLRADSPQPRYLKHFSHRHALRLSEVEEEDYDFCSVCEQKLSGVACRCTKPRCDFQLHKSCFELPQEIPHESHPEHSLVLLSSPPYKEDCEFTCSACSLTGTAFGYHCKICKFDLHVKCATLSENVKREDHEHPLKLFFSSPYKKGEENNDDLTFYCDVCQGMAEEGSWVYYCQECDFGTHLDCVMADREDPAEEIEQLSEANLLLSAQMQLKTDSPQLRYLKHFSHHHALRLSEVEEEDYVYCSSCEEHLSGLACRCTKPRCDFQLHKSCFELPQEIPHNSHPEHSLVLLSSPPYEEDCGKFTCSACSLTNTASGYHCKICQFGLHVKCATLSENVKREDHEHPLTLLFSSPYKKGEGNNNDLTFYCDVCQELAEEGCWVYYCQECDFGTHLDCVTADREDPSVETGQLSEENSLLTPQMQLQTDSPQLRYLKHFSHHHALRLSEVEEEDYVFCSGCEQRVSGLACRCTKPRCDFQLHKSCFGFPQEIPHKSHPEHSLVLLSSPPYKENGEFTCNACSSTGTAFDYHCKICQFDLHVKCATLSENVEREDHEHPLKLLFSSPYKKGEGNKDDLTFYCDVCQGTVEEGCWVYYCQECDFGTHLDCVMADREDPAKETEQLSEANSLLSAQMQLQQLQFQMRMNRQSAQMIIGMGQSLANLV